MFYSVASTIDFHSSSASIHNLKPFLNLHMAPMTAILLMTGISGFEISSSLSDP